MHRGAIPCGSGQRHPSVRRALSRVLLVLAVGLPPTFVHAALGTAAAHAASRAWSITRSPNPPGSTAAALSGVACPTTTSCVAVGNYSTDPTGTSTLSTAQRLSGGRWSLMPITHPPEQTGSALNDVSCPRRTSCFAVGARSVASTLKGLVEHWNGTTWSGMVSHDPSSAVSSFLSGVSCPSRTSCFAVGNYATDSAVKALFEHWNGKLWGVLGSPRPPNSADIVLNTVSCRTTRRCVAVGYYTTGSTANTLAELWNGKRWRILPSPNVTKASATVLNGVSCPTTDTCIAVGYYTTGATEHALTQDWNGTRWRIIARPRPAHATRSILNNVSCPKSTSCFAVGDTSNHSTETLVMHWNGTRWTITRSPNPASATISTLNDVRCAAPNICIATGYSTTPTATTTLIEKYA